MKQPSLRLALAGLSVSLLGFGCATTQKEVHQFEPIPQAAVGAQELAPVHTRSVTDLLRDADAAFREANAAQEKGDHEAALRHYTLMLELLTEADLDPSIFYSLRSEFANILETTHEHAKVFDHDLDGLVSQNDLARGVGFGELKIPFPLPEHVLREIEEMQKVYPKNFQGAIDRSYRYTPYIRQALSEAGLPQELVYVAMIESHFTPKIVSRAGAGGMWQFMKATGRRYNLRVDSYVDERYNWQRSTEAAIGYLSDLYRYFDGDWSLAITAYNMGEGGLERAIAANGGERNFWKLIETPPAANRIQRETKKYYPKFLAALIVMSNPERYGFRRNPQSPENTMRIPVTGMYALADLNKASGLPSGTLERLNPDLVREVTPPNGEYRVAVPVEARNQFMAALSQVRQVQYAADTHTVRRGETISQISAKYGVAANELMKLNRIRSARSLQAGQRLKLPNGAVRAVGGGSEDEAAPVQVAAAKSSSGSSSRAASSKSYVVKRGDTLFDIARAHRVSINDLQSWNNLGRRSRIHVGQKLQIRSGAPDNPAPAEPESNPATTAATVTAAAPQPAEADAPTAQKTHVVRAGEYPAKIASVYGVPLDDLLRWNNLSPDAKIRIGDTLVVASLTEAGSSPGAAQSAAPTGGQALSHTVSKGETASIIAAKYGVSTRDLLSWNKLSARSVLHIGDKLTVYAADGKAAGSAASAPEPTQLASAETPSPDSTITHVVSKGHNPTTIARRYGVKVSDLYKWNNWSNKHVLHVGEKVLVHKR